AQGDERGEMPRDEPVGPGRAGDQGRGGERCHDDPGDGQQRDHVATLPAPATRANGACWPSGLGAGTGPDATTVWLPAGWRGPPAAATIQDGAGIASNGPRDG